MTRYLVKAGPRRRGRNSVVIADELMVEHPIQFRLAGSRQTPIGRVGRLESTGKRDSRRFRFIVREGTLGTGVKTSRSRAQAESSTSAAEVKKVVRALRPQEEEKLDAIDQQRHELHEQLDALEAQRDELVRSAFSKGNVVRVAELEEMAAEEDRIWQERKRILGSLGQRDADELRELLQSDPAVKADEYLAERVAEELAKR